MGNISKNEIKKKRMNLFSLGINPFLLKCLLVYNIKRFYNLEWDWFQQFFKFGKNVPSVLTLKQLHKTGVMNSPAREQTIYLTKEEIENPVLARKKFITKCKKEFLLPFKFLQSFFENNDKKPAITTLRNWIEAGQL